MSSYSSAEHFSLAPEVHIPRSRFDRSSSVKLTFNTGELIPFYVDEVLPGDTFDISTSKVVRMQTPLTPFMDNLFLDTFWFFVPNRLVWSHWKEFMGENSTSAWLPSNTYSIPQIKTGMDNSTSPATPHLVVGSYTLGDYMGVFDYPDFSQNLSVSALPFRAYALICNEWFRDENLQSPLNIPTGDADQWFAGYTSDADDPTGTAYINDVANGGRPFIAAKMHDYFTSCLPSPAKIEKGSVQMLLGTNLNSSKSFLTGDVSGATANPYILDASLNSGDTYTALFQSSDHPTGIGFTPNNVAMAGDVLFSINQLRLAFATQHFVERDNNGTRYTEILRNHFGVISPDARLQRPEYLGGNRVPINVNQVVQQSSTSTDEYLGDTAAFSMTTDSHDDFVHSFTEHGYLFGLCVVRYPHTYDTGINRMWLRRNKSDFYFPEFANISNQPVYGIEIQSGYEFKGIGDSGSRVFGYQEAWSEYRYKPSRVAGEMRPGIENSLAFWHLSDFYDNTLPVLGNQWIKEDKTNVDRVLSVTSKTANQFFGDFYVKNYTTRPMPVYSIPGLDRM